MCTLNGAGPSYAAFCSCSVSSGTNNSQHQEAEFFSTEERKQNAEDKSHFFVNRGVKSFYAPVKRYIHICKREIKKRVERVCNRKHSHIVGLAITVLRGMLAWRGINFLRRTRRIGAGGLSWPC